MRVVLFLGAGFSRAWGLPIMNEFFQYAKASNYLEQNNKDFLRNLQMEAQKGVSFLEVRRDNLEEILSFCLASESFNSGYPKESDNRYDKLCHILQEVYRRIDLKEWHLKSGLIENVRKLLGINKGDRPTGENYTLITTNYDVMIEFCISLLGITCTIPGRWTVVPKNESEIQTGVLYADNHHGPLLCKLHGSLNWFVQTDINELMVENSILAGDYINENHEHQNLNLPKVSYGKYKSPRTPLIIPPTLFKMQTEPYFREIWNSAGKALQKAEKLVFVGFSFPDSDTYIKYFLAANLHENVDLMKIDVVDPNANIICEKLEKSNYGIHFKDRLNPIVEKWENKHYSVIS